MKRGNHRENDIGLKLIRSAGKTDNDIYSLSEFIEVINEAYGTQKFMSKNIFKHWRPPCSQYHRATYRHGKSQQIDKDLNLTLLMLEWRILKKIVTDSDKQLVMRSLYFYPAVPLSLRLALNYAVKYYIKYWK